MSKEHPILFSTPMVHAILKGRKKMTRRIVKGNIKEKDGYVSISTKKEFHNLPIDEFGKENYLFIKCPYGEVGDLLYVKETFGIQRNDAELGEVFYCYKADDETYLPKWKPSIFMPKAAARIWLEITKIKVERLRDISQADARAEGVKHVIDKITGYCGYDYINGGYNLMTTPYHGFMSLWQSINGLDSWDANPWVWVIEFKRINHE